MGSVKRLIFALLSGCLLFFLSNNISFAQAIKYSVGPVCKNGAVVCKNSNEAPTCLSLNPKVHLEKLSFADGEKINRYEPSCNSYPDNLFPNCTDIILGNKTPRKDIIVECVEFVKCQVDKNKGNLVPTCSDGKVAKCLGNNDMPSCTASEICGHGSVPICDYVWQANASF